MSQQPELVTVTVAIDRWVGTDLVSTLLGAWSTAQSLPGGQVPELLESIRAHLGGRWRTATVAEIEECMRARRVESTPWEQISLF